MNERMNQLGSSHKTGSVTLSKSMSFPDRESPVFLICGTRCLTNQLCLLKIQFLVPALGVLILVKGGCLPEMHPTGHSDVAAARYHGFQTTSCSADLRFYFDKKPEGESGA